MRSQKLTPLGLDKGNTFSVHFDTSSGILVVLSIPYTIKGGSDAGKEATYWVQG